ncbi:MAG TPA: glutamine--fructose-6-phosphate transaminase (isomerizing) [Candidatus Dormibacteraeota bacterium]|nr:glutamine--fructose-6-phosphate transaminase (isomerizing) [Candidatus Dormibacteraeota bacterium]
MCGIIGYLGTREAAPVLMDGLRRLEYRGYDSAGVAVVSPGAEVASVVKCAARVEQLIEQLRTDMPAGSLGVGHTRWATHGKPTVLNAHPHTDCGRRITVVHNGIIENFRELREELEGAGHEFLSDTDTEVVPHLIEHHYRGDFVAATRHALGRLRGAYALVMFSLDEPELLVGARLNAPLVVGLGEGEYFIASDIAAIVAYTKKVLVLGEGEMVVVTSLGPVVTSLDGIPVEPRVLHVDWDVSQAERSGYPHFMLKEIHETPEAAANALRGRLDRQGHVEFTEFEMDDERLRSLEEVRLLGMGTSLHAALAGEHVIEDWAGLAARAQDSSEFRYRRPVLGGNALVVAITQSGETADTIVALRAARATGALGVAVTNVVGSTAARDADGAIYLQAGPEIGVASTKTFVAHLVSLYLLALRLATARRRMSPERCEELAAELRSLPDAVRHLLAGEPEIARLAHRYAGYRNFMYVGRGLAYPVALEGALKLKEISYVHAEGTSGGELKHGPIALLDAEFPVVAVCTASPVREKTVGNVHEVVARGAPVLAVVSEGDRSLEGVASDLLEIPRTGEAASAVLASVALQLFAYHLAVELGRDVDRPRNLAKSVTVE